MNRQPASQCIRHAAARIAACIQPGKDTDATFETISATIELLELADDVEVMEERLRPRTWRERRAGRFPRRMSRRLCAVARRLFSVAPSRAAPATPPAGDAAPAVHPTFATVPTR